MTEFISLHNHTQFSLLDSLVEVKELFHRAKELGQKAVAITDHGSLAANWDAYKVSKETGVKFIVGCEMYFLDDVADKDNKIRHVIFLAKNAVGYKNLLTLNKVGFDNKRIFGKRVYPIVDWKMIEEYSEGLICLTSCGNGIISQALMKRKFDEAEKIALRLEKIFGKENLGLEVHPNNMKRNATHYNDEIDQTFLNRQIINLGKKLDLKVVPTCNTHYLNKEDAETHDVLLAIGSGQPVSSGFRIKYSVPDFYLKSGDEVKSFFSRNYGDELAEQLCANSVYFADLCEIPDWIDPKYSNPSGKELPVFPVKSQEDYKEFLEWSSYQPDDVQKLEEDKQYLRFVCDKGFVKKVPADKVEVYRDRLEKVEYDVLEYHGFSSYMLIVSDFLKWARNNKITTGFGRGSAGGSLVAYLSEIHFADPIKYGLIFERFHNKEKLAYPDIDSDIAPSGRDKVKEYLINKYGQDNVAHVSNVNTITPKVYVRDVARACQLGGGRDQAVQIGNEAADSIPKEIHSIDEALEKCPLFIEYTKKYPEFIKYKKICGKYRAWSTHAGGIIIAARSLTGLVPVRRDKDGNVALEYDKNNAEENGLVKMDILGLSTLDIIDKTFDLIEVDNPDFDRNFDIETYDEAAYNLISSGKTFGVFQLGTSGGTIDLCKKIKPKSIDDISHINSLARPSARDIRDVFIKHKEGKQRVILLHPSLERAFGSTYGCGLYEESLMYLAQDVAGWTLLGADKLRKLTKEKGKNPKKAQQWKKEFIEGAVNNGILEIVATKIWDDVVEKFQGYGFNLSHSILYSMTSYKTAYLKAHYPIQFLLANLMAELSSASLDADKNVEKIKEEIRNMNIKILPPNINTSNFSYSLSKDGTSLLTGLDGLKFVGDDAIVDLVEKRPFKDFFDFMSRVDSKKVRANSIQALAATGALDCFGLPRKVIYLYCSDYRKKLQAWSKKHNPLTEVFQYPFPDETEWSSPEIYALENHYLGEAFSCTLEKTNPKFFAGKKFVQFANVKSYPNKQFVPSMVGEIKDIAELRIKKETSKYFGRTMYKMTIQDIWGGRIGLTVFPKEYDAMQKSLKTFTKKDTFEVGMLIHFSGMTNLYENDISIIIDTLYNASLPPSLPEDLKAKKVSMKISKAEKKDGKSTSEDIFDELENDLYDKGLIEINDSEND